MFEVSSVQRKSFLSAQASGGGDVFLCIETSRIGWQGKVAGGLPVSLSGFIIG